MSSDSDLQTDQTLEGLDALKWNQNPSFSNIQTSKEAVVAVRTAESYLAEVGRRAIARGLVSKSRDAYQVAVTLLIQTPIHILLNR